MMERISVDRLTPTLSLQATINLRQSYVSYSKQRLFTGNQTEESSSYTLNRNLKKEGKWQS